MNMTKKMLYLGTVLLILIVLLWIGGFIPKKIGKITAMNYVKKNYVELNLQFSDIEYSRSHGSFFAVFKDSEGKDHSFQLESRFVPTTIWKDPFIKEGQ